MKVGDRVRRINSGSGGFDVGDTDVIIEVRSKGVICRNKDTGFHSFFNIELVEEAKLTVWECKGSEVCNSECHLISSTDTAPLDCPHSYFGYNWVKL